MAEKKKRATSLVLGAGVLAALVLLATQGSGLQFWKNQFSALSLSGAGKTSTSTEIAKEDAAQPKVLPPAKIAQNEAVPPLDESQALNGAGVALVMKKKLWEGMAFFDRAIRLDPTRIIPIINMAVVLTDLGLSRPAARYIAMAEAIDPAHPWLRQNFSVGIKREKSSDLAGTDTVYEPRVLNLNKTPKEIRGIRLWDDETLRIWGLDGDEVYGR